MIFNNASVDKTAENSHVHGYCCYFQFLSSTSNGSVCQLGHFVHMYLAEFRQKSGAIKPSSRLLCYQISQAHADRQQSQGLELCSVFFFLLFETVLPFKNSCIKIGKSSLGQHLTSNMEPLPTRFIYNPNHLILK